MSTSPPWSEIYDGGSPEAEQAIFETLAQDMLAIQEANRQAMGLSHPARTLHNRMVAGIAQASLAIDADMPADLAAGYFQPGAVLPAALRLSNASAIPQHDGLPDMRGAALRILVPGQPFHDLLMTSFPVSHARNARQFVEFAQLAMGDRASFPARLVAHFGEAEARRMGANLQQGIRPCASFALERFWSRGAYLWGAAPVQFQLRPAPDAAPAAPLEDAPDALHRELAARLAAGPVRYRLALQRYVDEATTPIEDGGVEWTEEVSPPVEVATLDIPTQDLSPGDGAQVEGMAFNPWNVPEGFRPLGNLNRVRKTVYASSARRWLG